MGFAQNIVMLMLIISILSDTVGVPAGLTTPSIASALINGNVSAAGSQASDYIFYGLMTDPSTGIFVVVTVILGLFVFPNPYAIFAGLALAMLGTFIVLPYNTFHSLPTPINIILTLGFGMCVMFGVLNWFKGGTGEI